MTADPNALQRLQALLQIVQKESRHLLTTDQRLFAMPFTEQRVLQLDLDVDLAERVDAFVSRFGRLQDTLADKLLPALLVALSEPLSAAIDNLDKAERLGLIASTDAWLAMRKLRNQMVHEYVQDPKLLADALQAGHDFVPILSATVDRMTLEIRARGWA